MKDHYRTLGLDRNASPDDIKRAYRKLASQHHPDKGGNKERFQEIQEAYSVLGDDQRRQEYDSPQPQGMQFNFGQGFDLNQLFAMFGQNVHGHSARTPRLTLWIGLRDVAEGGDRTVAMQVGDTVSNVQISIPAGLSDGDTIRYPGLAPGGHDLIITFKIRAEPGWSRDGQDLSCEVEISFYDLILGGEVTIRDIRGRSLALAVPAGTQPGSFLRLKGQGLPPSSLPGRHGGRTGDLLVKARIRMPERFSDEFLQAVRRERGH